MMTGIDYVLEAELTGRWMAAFAEVMQESIR